MAVFLFHYSVWEFLYLEETPGVTTCQSPTMMTLEVPMSLQAFSTSLLAFTTLMKMWGLFH